LRSWLWFADLLVGALAAQTRCIFRNPIQKKAGQNYKSAHFALLLNIPFLKNIALVNIYVMKTTASIFFCLSLFQNIHGASLHVGQGHPFTDFEQAAAVAQAGDSIVFHAGLHITGQYFSNLQGNPNAWIYLTNAPGEEAVFHGGDKAIQMSDAAFVRISGLVFEQQAGNGVNMDDGGTYGSPARHVVFENCTFRDLAISGNFDLLKLSGLNDFEILNCTFQNGADGGSGIDMVGCHNGLIKGNYFENMGSNSIQAKGGTQHIRIEGNFFRNGGQRTLNMGGNTGLPYFRPIDAPFEAADLQVYSNIIVGSWAAVAFVGAIHVEVVNNTIYQPENWVLRILQESVDPQRFIECGDNLFMNNLVYLRNNLSTETNIGPNTRPESFSFTNNLWYNADDPMWDGPAIPVEDLSMIINEDPDFLDPENDDFLIPISSPGAGAGYDANSPELDFYEMTFNSPRSIGAIEANPISADFEPFTNIQSFDLFPNPGGQNLTTTFTLQFPAPVKIELITQTGQRETLLEEVTCNAGVFTKTFSTGVRSGWHLVKITAGKEQSVQSWMRVDFRP